MRAITEMGGEHAGSFFEVRATVEPLVEGDEPLTVVIYVLGVDHDRKGSVLLELETMGDSYNLRHDPSTSNASPRAC